MEVDNVNTNTLTWHTDGKFEVVLTNGAITSMNFCEPGKGPADECGKCLTSTDFKYLKQVHQSLGELFDFIEKEDIKRKHSYALQEKKSNTEQTIINEPKALFEK